MSGRSSKPTKRGAPPPSKPTNEYSDDAPTSIYDSGEHPPKVPKAPVVPAAAPAPAKQAFQTISMKTPADPNMKPIEKAEREMPHVRLRAMSEVAKQNQPQNLGNLAPPYNPAEARARTMRELVVWGCLAVMIASAIALVVWFVAT